jgi:Tol biopolymer transport system component
VLTGAADELAAVPSPDGSLVVFLSDTTGRLELFVQWLDDATTRLQLTTTGGSPARWSRDGRRLSWFSADGKLVTATLVTTPALAVTGVEQVTAEVVPETTQRSHAGFDIAADGRVLVAEELRATFETVLVRNALGARAIPR